MFYIFFIFWCLHAFEWLPTEKDSQELCTRHFATKVIKIATRETAFPQRWRAWAQYMDWTQTQPLLSPKVLQERPLCIEELFKGKILPESVFLHTILVLKEHSLSIDADEKVYEKVEEALTYATTTPHPTDALQKMVSFFREPNETTPVLSAFTDLYKANQAILSYIIANNAYHILIVANKSDPWSIVEGSFEWPIQWRNIISYARAAKDMLPLVKQNPLRFRLGILSYVKQGVNYENTLESFFTNHGYLFQGLQARAQYLQSAIGNHINDLAENAACIIDTCQNMEISHLGVYKLCRAIQKHTRVKTLNVNDILQDCSRLGQIGQWKKQVFKEYMLSGKLEDSAITLFKDFHLIEFVPLNIYTQVWHLLQKDQKSNPNILSPEWYEYSILACFAGCQCECDAVNVASKEISYYMPWSRLPKKTIHGITITDWSRASFVSATTSTVAGKIATTVV